MTPLLKKIIVPLFILIFASCVTEDEPENIGITPGEPLPVFTVSMSDGEIISSSDLKGKVAVIEFFNTGCKDCRQSLPQFQLLYEEYKGNPEVCILAIAREESEESIIKYWEENELTIPFSPQPDRTVYNLFATVGIPRIFIFDKSGILRYAYGDADRPTASILSAAILSLLPAP
ncbi:MAG: TlpA family protein disulfide reductase [Muribaculaceae bacterium]|nr:TlpA family protein disulfide reductase [Muribaculaceae bacterium]